MTETFEKYLERHLINKFFKEQVKDCSGAIFTVSSVKVKSGYDGLEIHFSSKNGDEGMYYSCSEMPEVYRPLPVSSAEE